jgi:serine/threonine protein kinase
MGPCPDENNLSLLAQGKLSSAVLAGVEDHLDGCETCREVVVHLGALNLSGGLPQGTPGLGTGIHREFGAYKPGDQIGRYEVLGPIGRGAMGVVYAAVDHALERKIAIKLVAFEHDLTDDEDTKGRLAREGKALARVRHPNVVDIFDVGTEDGRLFIAMEHVDGSSARDWLKDKKPDPAEVMGVFAGAALGMAAAHEAGVVHRDFKLDNLLIDSEGHAKIVDFGLARWLETDLAEANTLLPGELRVDDAMTATGAMLGTPAYMSPEQLRGKPGNESGDQYAFFVALYEALSGQRPFGGATVSDLIKNIERGDFSPIAKVPRWLTKAIARGLSASPERRFDSMKEVAALFELAANLGLPEGGDSNFAIFGANLDRFGDEWAESYRSTCEETHVHGAQSEAMLDARMLCLDRHLAMASELVELMGADETSPVALEDAISASAALSPPQQCLSPSALSSQDYLPTDLATRKAVEGINGKLARVQTLISLARYEDALAVAEAATKAAKEASQIGLQADATMRRGKILRALERHEEAERVLLEAAKLAAAARRDWLLVEAWTGAARTVGYTLHRSAEGLAWANAAEAVLERMERPPELDSEWHSAVGAIHFGASNLEDGEKHLRASLELRSSEATTPPETLAQAHNNYGLLLRAKGDLDGALESLKEAAELRTRRP